MSRIVCVDCETTGLDPDIEDVFEVATIDLQTGTERVWRIQPRPEVVRNMHPKAVEVNRYYERTAHLDWSWDEPYRALEELWIELEGAHWLGAVPDFDARHITSLHRRFDVKPPRWSHRLRCVESMVMGRFQLADVDGLRDAANIAGVDPPDHTALGDARTVAAIYRAVMETP